MLAGLCAYAASLVLVSRDLMIADFMTYRGVSIMIARLADAGNWPLLASAAAQSITQDYAWGPALIPGLALALTQPTSRAIYTFALLALYAAPALLALAILARDLARRAGLRFALMRAACRSPSPPMFFAYPAAMAVAARGMPDVGGLVLTVCALRLAERLARLLALRQGHDASDRADDPPGRLGAGADAICDVRLPALVRVRRGGNSDHAGDRGRLDRAQTRARFRWKDAAVAAALGVLTLLALVEPGDRRLAAEPRRA